MQDAAAKNGNVYITFQMPDRNLLIFLPAPCIFFQYTGVKPCLCFTGVIRPLSSVNCACKKDYLQAHHARSKLHEHGHLITAIRKLGAVQAVSPYLLWQLLLAHLLKSQLGKEGGLIGKGKDPVYAQDKGLAQASVHQASTPALLLKTLHHNQGPNLRQILPGYAQGAAALDGGIATVG